MKHKAIVFLFAAAVVLSLTGCQSEKPAEQKQTSAAPSADDEDSSTEAPAAEAPADDTEALILDDSMEELFETESEMSLDPINPSDYLIADALDYVTLGDYSGISLEQVTYEVTDETVQSRIEEELNQYAEEVPQERPSQEGDMIYANLSYTIQGGDGETITEEDFFTTIGTGEFGEEFDENLIGISPGETKTFTLSFPEDDMMMEWAGETVDFIVEMETVSTLDIPEYDDDFVKNVVGFDSKEQYEEYLYNTLVAEYEETSYTDAAEDLFNAAMERTEFSGYPQDLYDSCMQESLDFYSSYGVSDDPDEIYDLFGQSIEEEVMSTVNRRLLVSAYCLANDITITEQDYIDYVSDSALYYGQTDLVSFEDMFTRSSLVWSLYESTFTSELYGMADVTEVSYEDWLADNEFELDSEFLEDEELSSEFPDSEESGSETEAES